MLTRGGQSKAHRRPRWVQREKDQGGRAREVVTHLPATPLLFEETMARGCRDWSGAAGDWSAGAAPISPQGIVAANQTCRRSCLDGDFRPMMMRFLFSFCTLAQVDPLQPKWTLLSPHPFLPLEGTHVGGDEYSYHQLTTLPYSYHTTSGSCGLASRREGRPLSETKTLTCPSQDTPCPESSSKRRKSNC